MTLDPAAKIAGDISANNTSERIGYVVLFIFGAFVWGTLLAQVGDIHKSSSARTGTP